MNELTNLYKLLSDETRLRILLLLYLDDLCVCQLCGILEAPQPRISRNLSRLRDMNLVEDIRQDKYVYYQFSSDDEVLRKNLEHIIANRDSYPVISSDLDRLKMKAEFKHHRQP